MESIVGHQLRMVVHGGRVQPGISNARDDAIKDFAPIGLVSRVYALARQVAPGETMSYAEVARRLGDPGAARAFGQALGHTRLHRSCRANASWWP